MEKCKAIHFGTKSLDRNKDFPKVLKNSFYTRYLLKNDNYEMGILSAINGAAGYGYA